MIHHLMHMVILAQAGMMITNLKAHTAVLVDMMMMTLVLQHNVVHAVVVLAVVEMLLVILIWIVINYSSILLMLY